MIHVGVVPWAGDNPYIYIQFGDMKVRLQGSKRQFRIFFNVQTVPSKRYEDLAEVATAAKWSFVIDTGKEQLMCTNVTSHDVRKTLDHAIVSYKHKDNEHVEWEIAIATKDAIELSKQLHNAIDKKRLVENKHNAKFKLYESVLKSTGELYRYKFSFNRKL